jgi:hypothetical protein
MSFLKSILRQTHKTFLIGFDEKEAEFLSIKIRNAYINPHSGFSMNYSMDGGEMF